MSWMSLWRGRFIQSKFPGFTKVEQAGGNSPFFNARWRSTIITPYPVRWQHLAVLLHYQSACPAQDLDTKLFPPYIVLEVWSTITSTQLSDRNISRKSDASITPFIRSLPLVHHGAVPLRPGDMMSYDVILTGLTALHRLCGEQPTRTCRMHSPSHHSTAEDHGRNSPSFSQSHISRGELSLVKVYADRLRSITRQV